MSSSEEFGRLEVVLDRSWEVQPVTWSSLTWWDPLPCGAELVASLTNPDPLPFPSPALSVMGHPPTPRRKLPPMHLNFRSTSASPSPIPRSHHHQTRYSYCDKASSSSSPLACPLPPSPDSQSFNSVFLDSEHSYHYNNKTPNSSSPQYHCSSPYPLFPGQNNIRSHYPTPDSNQRSHYPTPDSGQRPSPLPRDHKRSGYRFSFSKCPVPGHYSQSAIMTPPSPSYSGSDGLSGGRKLSLGNLPSGPNHSYY